MIDGGTSGADLIRVRIWNTNTLTVVYDSQIGSPVNDPPTTTAVGSKGKAVQVIRCIGDHDRHKPRR